MTRASGRITRRGVVALVLVACPAAAREPAGQDTVTRARAEAWFRAGLERERAGDHEDARRSFAAAYALVPSVDILWNLGSTELRGGHPVDALRHLRAYAAHPAARPDRVLVARERIAALEANEVGRLVVDAPDGAELRVDGEPAERASIELAAGAHVVTSRTADDRLASVVTTVEAGGVARVRLGFEEQPTPKSHVTPEPKALATTSPSSRASAPPAPARAWTSLGLAGGAVVTIAAGTLLAFAASGAKDDASRLQSQKDAAGQACSRMGDLCDRLDGARASSQRMDAASTGLFVVSGVLAGAAIASWVLWPGAPRASVVGTARGAGVALDATF